MKNFCKKGKLSGWTAFDRERRRKDAREPEVETECFPSLSSSVEQIENFLGNTNARNVLEEPFASVLQGPRTSLASGTHRYDIVKMSPQVGTPDMSANVNKINGVPDLTITYEMLMKHHPWADQSLIEDVLASVNYDFVEAATLLATMVSCENNSEENSVTAIKELTSRNKVSLLHKSSVDEVVDLSEPNMLIDGVTVDWKEYQDEWASSERMYMHEDLNSESNGISTKYVPIEPEWEEDDVYLVHRKNAIRMTRSASQHSKAAKDAYLRGDHLSAQLYSRKAREEWLIADKLNANAAKEILATRNSNNDEWTLDLHGLHASEAVNALQAHLQLIESRPPPKRITPESEQWAFPELASCSNSEKLGNRISFLGSRPASLHVITGKGNHSRGEPVILAAVRSFLNETGYRYDETRPGVIEVKPKFRL